MTAQLRAMVGDYLRVRRSLGYKLVGTEHLLFAFIDYLDDHGATTVSIQAPSDSSPIPARNRGGPLRFQDVITLSSQATKVNPNALP